MNPRTSTEQRSSDILSFGDAGLRVRMKRELRAEAIALASARGANPYSDFVMQNERRPDRDEAATIGRLMGVQVKAADGSLQPSRKKSKKTTQQRESGYQVQNDYIDDILRLRSALVSLAQNTSDPATTIRYIDPIFGDASVIREHLSRAVLWINQFAEEWDREQRTCGGQGPV